MNWRSFIFLFCAVFPLMSACSEVDVDPNFSESDVFIITDEDGAVIFPYSEGSAGSPDYLCVMASADPEEFLSNLSSGEPDTYSAVFTKGKGRKSDSFTVGSEDVVAAALSDSDKGIGVVIRLDEDRSARLSKGGYSLSLHIQSGDSRTATRAVPVSCREVELLSGDGGGSLGLQNFSEEETGAIIDFLMMHAFGSDCEDECISVYPALKQWISAHRADLGSMWYSFQKLNPDWISLLPVFMYPGVSEDPALDPRNGDRISSCGWMGELYAEKGDLYLRNVTIPGTHDSATSYFLERDQTLIRGHVVTQLLSLGEQFRHGIRFFDLRVKNETLTLYHGSYYLNRTLNDVTDEIMQLLEQYPSEGVIFEVSHEGNDSDDMAQVKKGLLTYFNALKKNHPEHFAMFHPDMKLSDIAGKIAFVFDTASLADGDYRFPGYHRIHDYSKELDNCGAGAMICKNDHNLSGPDGTQYHYVFRVFDQEKGGLCEEGGIFKQCLYSYAEDDHLEKTRQMRNLFIKKGCDYDGWAINNTSGYTYQEWLWFIETGAVTMNYPKNAYYQNSRAAQYLKKGQAGPQGIVVMDFAGWEGKVDYGGVIISFMAGTDSVTKYEVYGEELCRTCFEHNFYGNDDSRYTYPYRQLNISVP